MNRNIYAYSSLPNRPASSVFLTLSSLAKQLKMAPQVPPASANGRANQHKWELDRARESVCVRVGERESGRNLRVSVWHF